MRDHLKFYLGAIFLSGLLFWVPFFFSAMSEGILSPWMVPFINLTAFALLLHFRNGPPNPIKFALFWEAGIWVAWPYLVLIILLPSSGLPKEGPGEMGDMGGILNVLSLPVSVAMMIFNLIQFRLPAIITAGLIPLMSGSEWLSRKRGWPRAFRHILNLVGFVCWTGAYTLSHWSGDVPAHWAFSGNSADLKQTIIVPTLDSPIQPGKNIIWCSSFQLAWNELRDKVIGEPVRVSEAQEIADRLNQAQEDASDLPADSFYVASGWADKGIVGEIQRQMAKKFPHATIPDFSQVGHDLILFAYLTGRVRFTIPYLINDKPFNFKSSEGQDYAVISFGIRESDMSAQDHLRRQIEVLYVPGYHELAEERAQNEYVLDLCKESKPNQLVLARVDFKGSLAQTMSHVSKLIEKQHAPEFGVNDVLLVPELGFKIQHEFQELEGQKKTCLNQGFLSIHIAKAIQAIDFRLDRSGASIESSALAQMRSTPHQFVFNSPFLIYMKKRGAERPFFVMWVDNAELLTRDEKK